MPLSWTLPGHGAQRREALLHVGHANVPAARVREVATIILRSLGGLAQRFRNATEEVIRAGVEQQEADRLLGLHGGIGRTAGLCQRLAVRGAHPGLVWLDLVAEVHLAVPAASVVHVHGHGAAPRV